VNRPDGALVCSAHYVGDAQPPATDRRLDKDVHVDGVEDVAATMPVPIRVDIGTVFEGPRETVSERDSPVSASMASIRRRASVTSTSTSPWTLLRRPAVRMESTVPRRRAGGGSIRSLRLLRQLVRRGATYLLTPKNGRANQPSARTVSSGQRGVCSDFSSA